MSGWAGDTGLTGIFFFLHYKTVVCSDKFFIELIRLDMQITSLSLEEWNIFRRPTKKA